MKKHKKPCVYQILNTTSNKRYIGSCVNFFSRRANHIQNLRLGRHILNSLQDDFNIDASHISITIIEECPAEIRKDREQYWMDFYESYNSKYGYNICHNSRNSLGYKHTVEAKEKSSKANKGIKRTEEFKNRMRLLQKGRKISEERRLKMIGQGDSNAKLDNEKVTHIKRLLLTSISMSEIGRMYGVSPTAIWDIKHGHKWSHVCDSWEVARDALVGYLGVR